MMSMNAKKHNLVDLPLHEISKKQCIQTNDKNELYFSLSEMRRVTLSLFKGQQYVNVREYYRNENDESLVPGRKGMALTMEQWDQLFLMHKEIDEIVHCIEMEEMVTEFTNVQKRENGEYEAKLSEVKRITVRTFRGRTLIDFRNFYQKDGVWTPGKKGIALSVEQWGRFVDQMDEVMEMLTASN